MRTYDATGTTARRYAKTDEAMWASIGQPQIVPVQTDDLADLLACLDQRGMQGYVVTDAGVDVWGEHPTGCWRLLVKVVQAAG